MDNVENPLDTGGRAFLYTVSTLHSGLYKACQRTFVSAAPDVKNGLFDLFARRPALSEGLEQYRNTSGAVLLDVRTPEEYRDGHLPGAKNLPLDRLDTIAEPSGSPLFVYCRSGARSAQAKARLARAGYSVTDLGGLLGYRGPLEA